MSEPALTSLANIRHHRIPAPRMSFIVPNLPGLLQEIEAIA
jgi:hypothetical protein